jgi:hypothetical protein
VEMPIDEVVATLKRCGLTDLVDPARSELPDPVGLDQLLEWAEQHGVNREFMVERMGGSP